MTWEDIKDTCPARVEPKDPRGRVGCVDKPGNQVLITSLSMKRRLQAQRASGLFEPCCAEDCPELQATKPLRPRIIVDTKKD